jgi:site-specific DNA recombinase
MKTRPHRTLGYIRVSTQRQADEGISMPNQEAQLRAFCLRKDCKLVKIHSEGGYSGTNDNRPGLQTMFAEAMRPGNGITEIIV